MQHKIAYSIYGVAIIAAVVILCSFEGKEPKQAAAINTPFKYNLPPEIPSPNEPADNPTTLNGVALGKKLFYDKMLSANHTIACAGCHNPDKYFTDDLPLSKGVNGKLSKRNAMPLFNMAWVSNYFWDGRAKTLEDVIHFPLTDSNEMAKSIPVLLQELNKDDDYRKMFYNAFGSEEITEKKMNKALAQYLRSITSFQSPLDSLYPTASAIMKAEYIDQPATMKKLFAFSDKTIATLVLCEKCHSNISYGNNHMRNNGLDITNHTDKGLGSVTGFATDEGLFKSPSLRNLPFTAPYMHDGRFKTLEEVLEHYNSGIQPNPNLDPSLKDEHGNPIRLNLSQKEKDELLYFLRVLMTDKNFAYN